jgi:hypothetical protein
VTLQRVVGWVTAHIVVGPAQYRPLVALPLVVIVVHYGLWVILRRLAPWLLTNVVRPLAAFAAGFGGVFLLGAQALLALPFRLARAAPSTVFYVAGDCVVAGARATQRRIRWLAEATSSLSRRTPAWFCLLAALAVVWWWNNRSAVPNGGTGQSPVSDWVALVNSSLRDLKNHVFRR